MRFKKSPQLPGAGRTRAWHHHGSHTPTSPRAILLHTCYMSTQTFPPSVICNKKFGKDNAENLTKLDLDRIHSVAFDFECMHIS